MEIQQVILNNVGLFRHLEISFAPTPKNTSKITVFVGNNGAGKTSILKAIATSISWFTARLRTEKSNGNFISEDDILNTENTAVIKIEIDNNNQQFNWTIARTRKGRKVQQTSNLHDCTQLANYYREYLDNDAQASFPLIAFYPVERIVLDIPLKIKTKHTFFQLDGYDNSLNQGVDFRRFFEWFREREDTENESGISNDVLKELMPLFETNQEAWQRLKELNASAKDRQLTAVRTAIHKFMPYLDNLRVRRKPRLHMAIDKNGVTLNVAQLSQGEKSLMALVGDIARRLATLNPSLENPLTGNGIVLIDEVDLHLHPSWQRSLCERLMETFPNCQFILTTHSPLVISDYKNVLAYSLNDGELQEIPSQYGQDVNTVLLDVMNTSIRNEKIDSKLKDLLDAIQNYNLSDAESLISELARQLSNNNNLELVKAKLLLRKQKLRHETH